MSNTIELSKKRDFGEIISDTFLFARENFVPLIKCFFIFCGFFLAATVVLGWVTETRVMNVASNMSNLNSDSYDTSNNPLDIFAQLLGIQYIFLIIFALLSQIAIQLTVISYMAVYKAKGNMPAEPAEVWGYFKYHFFRVTVASIPIFILMVVGFVCCIIPGIWLFPILSLIYPIMIIENIGFGNAFSQSFRIIKDNWWATFGALFIIGIIVAILRAAITLPIGAADAISLLLRHGKNTPHLSPTLMLLSLLAGEIAQVFYILTYVTLTFCYFNLTEQKDATGLMERIQQLGNTDTDNSNKPAEEY